ncbi:MAG: DUF370 domain-containing protein [Clostridia bacterium]|nr:DUF370 domain-containing protein [Clostridia bacterium]MBR3869576.1 DUF370 domain-containing protein [Clostridia bacterium]
MYLHLGQSTVITTKDLIGIFDMDVTTVMKSSRDYLSKAEKNGQVVNVSYELPKSFVVCSDGNNSKKVYISQIAPSTLLKRAKSKQFTEL